MSLNKETRRRQRERGGEGEGERERLFKNNKSGFYKKVNKKKES